MTTDKPAWLRILEHRREFGFKIGPTLPFVLGAIQEAIGKAPSSRADGQRTLHNLLRAIEASGCGVEILWCPTTNAYVACSCGGDSLNWRDVDELGASIDSLAASLWNRYGDAISSGKYSKNDDWHEFTADEAMRIKAVLQDEP